MTKDAVLKLLKAEAKFEIDKSAAKRENPKLAGIRAWWNFSESKKISASQKNRIARVLKSRIARNGALVVAYKKHPTEQKNRGEAIAIMTRLVAHALKEDDQPFKQIRTSSQQDVLIRRGRRN
jgi:hypothetical protein